jgi:TolA-binding protein
MVAALTRLVGEFPESKFATSTRLLLGSHHFDAKRYAEAAKHYQAAADRAAGDDLPKALYNLGWSLDKAEKPDEAAAAFDRLAGRAPDGPFAAEAHCLIGLIRQRQSKHDEAAARFQRALAAKPSPRIDEVALFGFGESLRTLGKPREALGTYQALIARYPEGRLRLDAQCGCGLASQQLGAYADAQEAFRKVIAATKTEAAARAQYGLGECEFLQGHYKEALAQYLAVDIRYAYEKWRAAALLRAMECHAKLGNRERVRFYHAQLAEQFPKSELLPQANKLLDTLEPPKPRE